MSGSVVVLGGANVDSVFATVRIPRPGETMLALNRSESAGGKGLNQAVAAARAGAPITFIGSVGDDADGRFLERTLVDSGVTPALRQSAEATGSAFITVDAHGENSIVVAAGANAEPITLTREEGQLIANSDVLLLQLETPASIARESAAVARAAGVTVILNAAPAGTAGPALIELVDVLIVNEMESAEVCDAIEGTSTRTPKDLAAACDIAVRLGRSGCRVVVTLGGDGAIVVDGEDVRHLAAPAVTVVDTSGAGDTLCGVVAAALAEGVSLLSATERGVRAASIAVQRPGAVPSIPWRSDFPAGGEAPRV